MSLVVVVLAVALAVGWARGGSLARLGALPVRRRGLVVAAFAVQLGGTLVGGPFHVLGLVGSCLLVVSFLAANRGVRGTGLVALGLLANAAVVGLNGAMPVSGDAAARAGIGTAGLLVGEGRHELADGSTRLPWLGDVVPVPLPVRPEVVSPGDVLVAAGLGQLVALGMTGTRDGRRSPLRPSRRTPPPVPSYAARPAPATPAARPRRPAPARTADPS